MGSDTRARYQLDQELLGLVEQAFHAASWTVRPHAYRELSHADRELLDPRQGHWALVLKGEPGRARLPVLRDRLSAAILEAESFRRRESDSAGRNSKAWRALALIGAPKLTDSMLDSLAQYANTFAPAGLSWGMVDTSGIRRLSTDLQDVERVAAQLRVCPPPSESAPRSSPFTDLGQWLLKVLLGPRLPEGLVHTPIDHLAQEPNRVARLAIQAGVSPGTVSKFGKALAERGFSKDGVKGIELTRIERLFEDWFRTVASQPLVERRAKFMFGGDPDAHLRLVRLLERHAGKSDGAGRPFEACLGLFSAARELGVDFVTGAPVHLLARDVSDRFLGRLGLRQVEDGASFDVIVRRPPFPEAVFRAAIELPSKARCADAIQCWLDLRSHPVRGAELADELWRHMGLVSNP